MQQQLENQQHTSLDGFGDDAFDCHTIADKNVNPNRTRNIISSSFIKGTHLDIKHTTSSSVLPSMSNSMASSPAFCRSSSSSSSSSDSGSSTTTSSSTPTIGVNLRVTGQCSQGGRKYMEDYFSVAYQQSENARDLEYAFIGIYDGHGGAEAATFAKEHLMMEIINQKSFWSDYDQDVLRAIREGYIATHYAMWREQEKWPKTANGLLSTAGTTATVAFIRREKIYIGHVGDSGIVLGYQNENENFWRSKQLTTDHKPESSAERRRINRAGGKVGVKSGVPRVVWNRPRTSCYRGPIRPNTPVDEIPFLAVARSLGDLWSYNAAVNEFVVSPDPDVQVIKINPQTFRCLIFGTDGLWNVVTPQEAVETVFSKESLNERLHAQRENTTADPQNVDASQWTNPSKGLVEQALKTWSSKKMRADNTSVVTVILYPPKYNYESSSATTNNITKNTCELANYTDVDDNEFSIPLMDQTSFQELAEKYLPPESFRNIIYNNIADDYETNINNYHNINNNFKNNQHQQHEEHMYWQQQQQQHHHQHHQQQQQQQQQQHDHQSITWEEKISMIYADILAPDGGEINDDARVMLHNATVTNVVEEAHKVEQSLQSFNEMLKPLTPYGNYTPTDAPIIQQTPPSPSKIPATIETAVISIVEKLDESSTCNSDLYINGFAETYNSLLDAHTIPELNEETTAKTTTIAATTTTIIHEHQEQQQPQPHQIPTAVVENASRTSVTTAASTTTATPILAGLPMQEILQEQQMYQQQCMSGEDGYMLTKLETRREQQRCGGIQTFKVVDGFNATAAVASASTSTATIDDNNMAYVATSSSTESSLPSIASTLLTSSQNWHNFHDYHSSIQQQQPHDTLTVSKKLQQQTADKVVAARLLELNSLLQQEHAEEQQVALEQHLKLQQQQQELQAKTLNILPEEQSEIPIPIDNLTESNMPESVNQEEMPAVEDVLMVNEATTEEREELCVVMNSEEEDEETTELVEEFLLDDEGRLDETVQINEISSSSSLTENLLDEYEATNKVKKIATPTLFIEKIEKIEILHDKPELVIETMPTSTLHRKNIIPNKTIKNTTSTTKTKTLNNIMNSALATTCAAYNKNNKINKNKNKTDLLLRKAMKSPYYVPFSVPTRSRTHALNTANKNNNNNVTAKSIQCHNLRITKQQFPNIPNENQRQLTAVNLKSTSCNVTVIKRPNIVTVNNNNNNNNNNNSNNIKERRQLRSGNNSNNAQNNNNHNNNSSNSNNKNSPRAINLTIIKAANSNNIINTNTNTNNNNNNNNNNNSKNNCSKNENSNNANNNVDYYSKRTLRTRNSLGKDMKAKANTAGIGGGVNNNQLNKNNALKRGISSVTTQLLRSNRINCTDAVGVGVAGAVAVSGSAQRDNFINTHVINLRSRQVASNAMVKATNASNAAKVVTRKLRNSRSNPNANLGVLLTSGGGTTINNKLADVNYGKTTTTSTRLQLIGSNHQLATTPPSAKLFRTASAGVVAAAMANTRGQRTAAMAAAAVFCRRATQRVSSNLTTTTTIATNNNNNTNMPNTNTTNNKNNTMSTINNKRINATSIAFSSTNVSLQNVRSGRVAKRLRR